MSKQIEQVYRDTFLTPEEIARDAKIREAVQKEFPPATSMTNTANGDRHLRAWMVRSGRAGDSFEKFEHGFVAIGWPKLGDLTNATNRDAIREMYRRAYPDEKPGATNGAVAMLYKFRNVVQQNDRVITYD